jgi:hypothetical protein
MQFFLLRLPSKLRRKNMNVGIKEEKWHVKKNDDAN